MSSAKARAIGFGVDYYHNMGPSERASLPHDSEKQIRSFLLKETPWEKEDDDLVQIATSSGSSFFLTARGKIYSCGTLHGKIRHNLTRTVIQLPLKCVEIAAGRHFGLARMEGGLAVCSWGAGHFGQLALGGDSAPFMDHPTVIEALLPHVVGSPIKSIAAGHWHGLAVTEMGEVYSWGCNRSAQCGFKPSKDPPTLCIPQRVQFDSTTEVKVIKVAGGRSHSVALDRNGKVYCWGACQYGQCGVLTRRRGGVVPPRQVESLSQVQIQDIAAGDTHTLALTGGGRLFGFGSGFEGQLGTGATVQMNPKPKLVGDLDFVAIEAGREWKLQQNNKLQGSKGETINSLSSSSAQSSLSQIPKIVSIQAAGNCSLALSSIGHLYVWGCNDVSNLGVPKPDPDSLPYVEPGGPISKASSSRQFHTRSFDSSHNLNLPQRVDCLSWMSISSVAASPTFLWCLGKERVKEDSGSQSVGRTLYEVQEAKRLRSVRQYRKAHVDDFTAKRTTPSSSDPSKSKLESNADMRVGDESSSERQPTTAQAHRSNSQGDSERKNTAALATQAGNPMKEKRRFSLPKAIGKIVRKASLSQSFRNDSVEIGDKKGRKSAI